MDEVARRIEPSRREALHDRRERLPPRLSRTTKDADVHLLTARRLGHIGRILARTFSRGSARRKRARANITMQRLRRQSYGTPLPNSERALSRRMERNQSRPEAAAKEENQDHHRLVEKGNLGVPLAVRPGIEIKSDEGARPPGRVQLVERVADFGR